MDVFTKSVLVVIAGALVAIAAKMWTPNYATIGDITANPDAAVSRILLVRVQGGTIAANVSGDVDTHVDGRVNANVTGIVSTFK